MSCEGYPTASNMKLLATDAQTINEVVTSTADLTTPASDGLPKTTLTGIDNKVADAISNSFSAYIGDWAIGLTFNAPNEYAVFNGVSYKPKSGSVLPYVAQGADPTLSPDVENVEPFSDVNFGNISDFASYSFSSVADMQAGKVGSPYVVGDTVLVINEKGTSEAYGVVEVEADVDLGSGLWAKRTQQRAVYRGTNWDILLKRIYDGEAVKIVCLGDSITAGEGVSSGVEDYPTKLKEILDFAYRLNNVTIVNKGVGGNTAANMIARFASDVVAEDPDGVILMAGMNDIRTRGVPDYAADMEELFRLCFEQDYALLSLDITPRWRTDNEGYDRQDFYRDALRGLAKAYNVRFVPLFDKLTDIMQSKNGFAISDITYDGVHYTPQGYLQIAGAVFAFGMASGQVGRKIGDFIEPFGGHFSPPTNSTWSYVQGNNSINNSRLLFTRDPGASSISLFVWVEDYEFCDLVCLASRQQNANPARSTIRAANRAIDEAIVTLDTRVSLPAGSTKTVYAAPLAIEVLQPGWNRVQINLVSDNTDIYIDGFFVSKRDDGVDEYKDERFNAGSRETLYELSDADANTKLTVMGQEGLLTDGSNRKLGKLNNSTNYPDYCAWYMQINRAATTVISFGRELTDNNKYGAFFELTITAGVGATDMDAVLDIVYRDGSRSTVSSDTFTAQDLSTVRFTIGQNNERVNVWAKGNAGDIADSNMVVGISDINISVTGGDIYIGTMYRLPKSTTDSPQPTTPFDGEQYTDISTPAIVKAIGGVFYSSTLT